ncbi:MAG TPA: DUF2964 domain-containing protein [Paraburkholderia sp.]|jgi:hypothetical protein
MVRMELRVVLATIATFVALAGIALAIHGVLYDRDEVMWTGVVSIALGMLGCVSMLTLWPRDKERLK